MIEDIETTKEPSSDIPERHEGHLFKLELWEAFSTILCIRHPEILLQEVASSPYIQEYKGIGSPYSYEKKYRDLCHWEKYQRRKARAKRKGKPLPEEARVPELGHQPEPDPRDYRMRTGLSPPGQRWFLPYNQNMSPEEHHQRAVNIKPYLDGQYQRCVRQEAKMNKARQNPNLIPKERKASEAEFARELKQFGQFYRARTMHEFNSILSATDVDTLLRWAPRTPLPYYTGLGSPYSYNRIPHYHPPARPLGIQVESTKRSQKMLPKNMPEDWEDLDAKALKQAVFKRAQRTKSTPNDFMSIMI